MLNEIINVSSGFQTSVNIAYDIGNESKIQGFIPTNSSIDLINELLQGVDTQENRANILSGAYGRGKSHIVLLALSILSAGKNKEYYNKLLTKMKSYDKEIYQRTLNYIDSKKRLLPVIISGSTSSLTQAFMNALQQALNNYGLQNIMPDSHFKAAVNTINNWKENYPDTYKSFKSKIDIDIKECLKELENHNTDIYQMFTQIYPELTAGSVFNPFVGFDVVNIFENVCVSIKEHGFSGLYIVYDEFGKYLETSISTATESDTKLLQDLAEKCTRSGNNPMHLLLICHKDISNYIDMNLPQDKVDGWRGVSGRFIPISLNNNFSQMYEVIAAAIEKDNTKWKSFKKSYEDKFSELANRYKIDSVLDDQENVEEVVTGCYPLHPSTVFILPRLSEKVAQNERTLFTFISSNQKNTLVEFIEKNEETIPFVTPDYLYDYFEPQFRKELISSDIYKIYNLSSGILKRVESDSLDAKIIKTLAIAYMIEQFDKMPPIIEFIESTYRDVVDIAEIDKSIENLINNSCIIYQKKSNHYLKLKNNSGVNIRDQINDRIAKLKDTNISVRDILNGASFDNYIYPVRYNDKNCITRYFEFVFSNPDSLVDDYYTVDSNASGLIQAVYYENKEEFNKYKDSNFLLNSSQTVVIKPVEYVDISSDAYEYMAVTQLREENKDDEVLFDEYSIYLEDLDEVIQNFISDYTRPEKKKSQYYHKGELKRIFRKSNLSDCLSSICESVYTETPLINNESLNKNILPTMAVNSRSKLVTALLECQNSSSDGETKIVVDENLGLTGTGQDVSFMRSTLIQTGIMKNENDEISLNLESGEEKIDNMLSVIKSFIDSTALDKKERSFAELYETLVLPENKIGLKRGVIPVYIALVLCFVKKNVVIRCNGSEVKINATTLNNINDNPEQYSILKENWDGDKRQYLEELEKGFSEFIIDKEKSYNGFSYIAIAMNRWYMSLPRCSKEMKRKYDSNEKNRKPIPKEFIKFLQTLKQPTENKRNYLIVDLPKVFGSKPVSKELAGSIIEAKRVFDLSISKLVDEAIVETKSLFKINCDKDESLTSILKDWYKKLKPETLQYQFVNNENKILSEIKEVKNDEVAITEKLAKLIVGLRIEDWNSDGISKYKAGIINFINTVMDYNDRDHSKATRSSDSCTFTFIDDNGAEVTRVFDKVEYSSRAKLLYNDISSAIEEMGQSITEQEKRQVLIEILEKMF